ncbi:hypothetical protein DD596_25260 [Enterobacter cloacae complex sp. 4DZ3-28B]|nr:hypothetical protein DD596_25260 [Enterobacter cloacae complex sp. 4DZ3-28B]
MGFSAFDFFGFFLFCFCLTRGEQVTDEQDFGWRSKGEDHFRSWFPFLLFVHLVTILYCSDIVWSKDLSAHFFCFLSILDQELSFLLFFLFYFLPFFDWEFSFFSFCFLPLFDWEFPFFSFFAFSLIGNFPSFPFCFRG